jgi:hypothetical protein
VLPLLCAGTRPGGIWDGTDLETATAAEAQAPTEEVSALMAATGEGTARPERYVLGSTLNNGSGTHLWIFVQVYAGDKVVVGWTQPRSWFCYIKCCTLWWWGFHRGHWSLTEAVWVSAPNLSWQW